MFPTSSSNLTLVRTVGVFKKKKIDIVGPLVIFEDWLAYFSGNSTQVYGLCASNCVLNCQTDPHGSKNANIYPRLSMGKYTPHTQWWNFYFAELHASIVDEYICMDFGV